MNTPRPIYIKGKHSFIKIMSYDTGEALRVHLPDMIIWFSYDEPIAFQVSQGSIWLSENKGFTEFPEGSRTTGRHLNTIDRDHGRRLPRRAFLIMLGYFLDQVL